MVSNRLTGSILVSSVLMFTGCASTTGGAALENSAEIPDILVPGVTAGEAEVADGNRTTLPTGSSALTTESTSTNGSTTSAASDLASPVLSTSASTKSESSSGTTAKTTKSSPPAADEDSQSMHNHQSGDWVKVSDETATYPSDQIPTTHNLFDPYSPKAPDGWGASRIGFVVHCEPTQFKQVDPIVNPGDPKSHHMHEFFGNPNVDENSTTQSLADTPVSQIECSDTNDKSAYWSPTVIQNGRQVTASHFKSYYKSPKPDTQPVPFGLRMIAGDMTATKNQSSQVGWWYSGSVTSQNKSSMISRQGNNKIVLRVNFPQCWDGKHLDSPDHKSHMAYAKGNSCPSTHPVKIAQVVTFTDYQVQGGSGFELSSGPWHTFHQDFWNVWSPEQMEDLHRQCNLSELNCRAYKSPELVPRGQQSKVIG